MGLGAPKDMAPLSPELGNMEAALVLAVTVYRTRHYLCLYAKGPGPIVRSGPVHLVVVLLVQPGEPPHQVGRWCAVPTVRRRVLRQRVGDRSPVRVTPSPIMVRDRITTRSARVRQRCALAHRADEYRCRGKHRPHHASTFSSSTRAVLISRWIAPLITRRCCDSCALSPRPLTPHSNWVFRAISAPYALPPLPP